MTLARNTAAYWTAQLGNYALAFVTSVFTAVHLGPEHRGVLVAVILANTLMVNLTNLGLQTFAMYFTGKSPERLARIHTAIVLVVAAISALDLVAVGMGAGLFRDALKHTVPGLRGLDWGHLALAVGVLPFSLYFFAAQGILSGLGRVQSLARFLFHYGAVMNGLNLVAVIACPFDRPRLAHALVLIWAVGQVAAGLGVFAMIRCHGAAWTRLSPGDHLREVLGMLGYGVRAFIGNFASALVNRMDHLFILSGFGATGIGIYNLSAKLAELIFQPSAAFENAAYARVASGSRMDSARLVQDLFRSNFLLNLALVGIATALARPLVLWVYRDEYADAVAPLVILLPGTLCMGGSRMLAMYFSAQLGRPQIPSIIAWATALLNITLLGWVVVHLRLGLAAAAAATSASYLFMILCYWVVFARATGLWNPAPYFLPRSRDILRLRRFFSRG